LKDAPVIFVIDDDAAVRRAIRRLLLSLHLPVRVFASAEDFLSHTEFGTHGCLILDVRLPGMDGLELQKHLLDQGWKLPSIIVTAHPDDEMRDLALRRGAVAYFRKPFERQQLLTSVNAAIAQS
jgi:FixJ family two-component response regulator